MLPLPFAPPHPDTGANSHATCEGPVFIPEPALNPQLPHQVRCHLGSEPIRWQANEDISQQVVVLTPDQKDEMLLKAGRQG